MKLVLLAAVVAAIAVPNALAAHQGGGTLNGTDRPGFTITLTQGGKKVTSLSAGTYTFKIADKSNIHNFHLTGPGVDKKTDVGKIEASVWKLTLKKGTYKYVCDPHASFMKGSFTVK